MQGLILNPIFVTTLLQETVDSSRWANLHDDEGVWSLRQVLPDGDQPSDLMTKWINNQ